MPVEELSTAVFNKDGIDFYNMECMFGFQVGNIFRSTLQLSCTMGLYVVTEIGHLNVPMSLEQLPAFLTSLDTLLIIANAYWSISLKSDATVEKESNKRDSLNNPQTPPVIENLGNLIFKAPIATTLLSYRRILQEMRNHHTEEQSQRGRHLS